MAQNQLSAFWDRFVGKLGVGKVRNDEMKTQLKTNSIKFWGRLLGIGIGCPNDFIVCVFNAMSEKKARRI
jgi:hypothetical protein